MAKRPSSAVRRRHWTEADARGVLAEWERSGKTLEAFARSRGLVPQRLAWWKKATARGSTGDEHSADLRPRCGDRRLLRRPCRPGRPAAAIGLPHGIVIEIDGASPTWIAALARELARSAS